MLTHWIANISFGVGALAFGLWLSLGLYWLQAYKGLFRVTLVWLALNTVLVTGIRIWSAVQNYTNDEFPPLDWIRLGFNISTLCLGLFLARYGRRMLIEESDRNDT